MSFAAVAASLALAYQFSPSTSLDYTVQVNMEGFIPAFGGNEGAIQIDFGLKVAGGERDDKGLRANSELTAFSVTFNGAKMPLTVDNAKQYFPKTNIVLSPQGTVLENDAPNTQIPFRVPGLDVKRFPEITYLPVELPEGEVEPGDKWEFTRTFSGDPAQYSCELKSVQGQLATISVKLKQVYKNYENESLEVVKDKSEAVSETSTELNGEGTVIFDTTAGVARRVDVKTVAVTTVKPLDGSESITRNFKTTLALRSAPPDQGLRQVQLPWWEQGYEAARTVWHARKNLPALLATAMVFGLDRLPGQWLGFVRVLPGSFQKSVLAALDRK